MTLGKPFARLILGLGVMGGGLLSASLRLGGDPYEEQIRYLSAGLSRIAISPSGQRILIPAHGRLYVFDTARRSTSEISPALRAPTQVALGGGFAPDGGGIIFSASQDPLSPAQMYTVRFHGPKGKRAAVPALGAQTHHFGASYTPEGSGVIFCASAKRVFVGSFQGFSFILALWQDVHMLHLDLRTGKAVDILERAGNAGFHPSNCRYSFSEDGNTVYLLASYNDGGTIGTALVQVPVDGGTAPSLISHLDKSREDPLDYLAVSKDGKHVLLVRFRDGELGVLEIPQKRIRWVKTLTGAVLAGFGRSDSEAYVLLQSGGVPRLYPPSQRSAHLDSTTYQLYEVDLSTGQASLLCTIDPRKGYSGPDHEADSRTASEYP